MYIVHCTIVCIHVAAAASHTIVLCLCTCSQVDHKTRTAVFEKLETRERFPMQYALLHTSPPQTAPAALRAAVGTKLVNADGFVDVHKYNLHHNHYANVWSAGDCAGLPNSKTAAAACKYLYLYVRVYILVCTMPIKST